MLALQQREECQTPEALSQYLWAPVSGMRVWVSRCVLFVKEYACPMSRPEVPRDVVANYYLQADKIEKLEKDHGWHEEQFDFILQFLRTILLKREFQLLVFCFDVHIVLTLQIDGASLIYTTPFLANSLQSLIHSSLGIHSLLKRQSLRHNVIDRDKILVPANWDSWGKIRIIREGFDMEGVSTAWSIEIQDAPEPLEQSQDAGQQSENAEDGTSAVMVFEQTIQDPRRDNSIAHPATANGNKIEVETSDMQGFLAKQVELLDQLRADDDKERSSQPTPQLEMSPMEDEGRVNEHIGPVQFNMGGIQVDAEDMLKKLKVSRTLYIELESVHSVTNLPLSRTEKPAVRKRKKARLRTQATRKLTTKHWQTSSPASSRSQVPVLAEARPVELHSTFSLLGLYFSAVGVHMTEVRDLSIGDPPSDLPMACA